jgi:hypothetical protein
MIGARPELPVSSVPLLASLLTSLLAACTRPVEPAPAIVFLDARAHAVLDVDGGSSGSLTLRNLGPGPLRMRVVDRARQDATIHLQANSRYQGALKLLRRIVVANDSRQATTFSWQSSDHGMVALRWPAKVEAP